MTLTIELPDNIYEAVRLEAEAYGDTAENRIERIITKTHELRVKYPLAEAHARLDRLVESGETVPLRDLIPTGNKGT